MSNEIAKINFTEDQVDLIRRQIAPKANSDELNLFLYQCKRTGLDPLARQIYAIHRGSKMTIQTSIDGFRVIAERSGDYGGQDEPIFEEKDGKLIKATVAVYRFRGDNRYKAAVGVAYWDEYKPGQGMDSMWNKMPHTMLSKVAEALALRKAYPQDLSGLYTNDEMQQAGQQDEVYAETSEVPDEIEKNFLRGLVGRSTLDDKERNMALSVIDKCNNYDEYQKIQQKLENVQYSIDQVQNPSKTEINRHINEIIR